MELAILFDHRFYRSRGGEIYSPTGYGYSFFRKRYLTVFDSLSIVARVDEVPPDKGRTQEPTEGDSVKVIDLGMWGGAIGFFKSRRVIVRETERFAKRGTAFVLLGPGGVASAAFTHLARRRYPFALEVVGDPWEAFSPGACSHPLRPLLRRSLAWNLRRQCRVANGALYVTRDALQTRYPCPGFTAGISDVILPAEAFAGGPRTFDFSTATIVNVGGMAQRYKGQDLLIDAAKKCVQMGMALHLVLVGDGKHRSELEQQATAAGIASRVRFAGEVCPASAVRSELDQADLFVLPSRTEGLPRALVEAMARALPCIGTDVGGVSELLCPADLVAPRDSQALAERIAAVITDKNRMAEMSLRNLRKAVEYQEQTLVAARAAFYSQLKEQTERTLRAGLQPGGRRTADCEPARHSAGV